MDGTKLRVRRRLLVAHDHEGPDGGDPVGHRLHGGDEVLVHEQHRVLRVVDDIRELVGEEPDVDRVEDGPHARHGEIRLEVPVAVPPEGAHPFASLHTEARERVGQLRHADVVLGVVVTVDPPEIPGHHLLLAEQLAVPFEYRGKGERVRHRRPPRLVHAAKFKKRLQFPPFRPVKSTGNGGHSAGSPRYAAFTAGSSRRVAAPPSSRIAPVSST